MADAAPKGTVTSLSSMFPVEEAQKAAKRVEEALSEKEKEMNRLKEFIADNTSLINLVQKLPDELHHDIMVPFGKAAFFPGRLIHTNELMVLLGEGYYAERTAKQTVEILKRRGTSLESQVDSLKAVMEDLKLEASFFDATASEAAEGFVEIREEYVEEKSDASISESGPLGQDSSGCTKADNRKSAAEDEKYAHMMSRMDELEKEELAVKSQTEKDEDSFTDADNRKGAAEDENYARIMARLDELEEEELAIESQTEKDEDSFSDAYNRKSAADNEKYAQMMARLDELEIAELAAKCDSEKDEDRKTNAAESDTNEVGQSKADFDFDGKKNKKQPSANQNLRYSEEYQSWKPSQQEKYKEPANCTGLAAEPLPQGGILHRTNASQNQKILSSANAHVRPERKVRFEAEPSSTNESPVHDSKQGFDSSKAFTGSIIERAHNLQPHPQRQSATSSQSSDSQPSKPVSRFKMQRK